MSGVNIEKLSAVDRAWLRMETPESPMTIVGIIGLENPMSVGEVRALLDERLLAHPRFSMQFVEDRWRRWQLGPAAPVDLSDHVRALPAPSSEDELLDHLSTIAGSLLPAGRPPWDVSVIEDYGGRTLLIVRLHHSLADGISLVQLLVSLCDDPPDLTAPRTAGSGRSGNWLVEGWRVVVAAIRLALRPPDPANSLKGPLTGMKRVAWSRPALLADVRTAAREAGCTVNDLLMGAVTGALRRVLLDRGEGDLASVRAMVPFNLRPPVAGQPLGNRFGLVLPELPVGLDDRSSRLRAVSERMTELKEAAEGTAAYFVLNFMGVSAALVESMLVSFFGRKSSLVVTNVPGPSERLRLGGTAIDELLFWVPQAGRIGLGISIISYAGTVKLGVLSDVGSVPEPSELVVAFEEELMALGVALPSTRTG